MAIKMKTISLFTSYGLGDLGLRAAGAEIVLMAELLPRRCAYLRRNFPKARVEETDLSDPARLREVLDAAERLLGGEPPFLLVATPPCQGMSTNGAGKIARAVEAGRREKLDPRNRLVLAALESAKRLRPTWILFENVVQMRNTVIEYSGVPRRILDVVEGELAPEGYSGGAFPVDFWRYGVPQDRTRLITVYGLGLKPSMIDRLIPPPDTETPITLRQAIGHMEPLDARDKLRGSDPLHRVKRMNDRLYGWVAACTQEGATAYDNECECGWCEVTPGKQGAGCPARCPECGELLPRPMTTTPAPQEDCSTMTTPVPQEDRIIRGFRTAYRRMSWDKPAPTVTMNLMTPSSDNKLHPQQNRTLSPAEAAVLQTVDRYPYKWGESPTDRELCDALGEAVPPLFFEKLLKHIASL
jgi:DNA (cytosine-5)-methyltransferase 1